MKRGIVILSLVLALLMCLGVVIPALAAETAGNVWETRIVQVNGYSFAIQECTNDDLSVVRTYTNPSPDVRTADVEQAKALLLALGMDEGNLELWEDESLLNAANGKDITVTDTYYGVNQKHGDPYIRVYHAACYQGSGEYLFSTDSHWLKMPDTRSYDSLGSYAQLTAVIPDSYIGGCSYDRTTVIDRVIETESISSKNFKKSGFAASDGWAGAAGVFTLPSDADDGEGNSVTYTNFRAHYEHRGVMNDPNTDQSFNSHGTYAHATEKLTVAPSISISSAFSGSIGISVNSSAGTEHYTAAMLQNYTGG